LAQFFARDDIPCVAKKDDQNSKGLILELDFDAILAQFTRALVDAMRARGVRSPRARAVASPMMPPPMTAMS